MAIIASIDPAARRIFLHADTVGADVHPIDIYREMRTLRKDDETLRAYDVFMQAYGNVAKGGGKFTERYVQLINGTRIVPFDTDHELTITGTIITDDGQEGIAVFDRTSLDVSTVVDINYVPPQVEVIVIGGGGSAPTAQEVADAVWGEPTANLTVVGSIGEYVLTKLLTFKKFFGTKDIK